MPGSVVPLAMFYICLYFDIFFRQNPLPALFHPCLVGKNESRATVKSACSGSRCSTCDGVDASCQAQDNLLLQVGLPKDHLLMTGSRVM